MAKVYIDSETCGLHSQMVLLQHAIEDGPIELYDVWRQPIRETLKRIEWLCENTIVGFNLVFDWFHIAKIYTVFRLANPDWIPVEHINELAMLEPQGQEGPALKPFSALDLLLHSRKGKYQDLMARENIRIKKVPTVLAYALAQELENRVQLDAIYFAKSKKKNKDDPDKHAPRWEPYPRHKKDGEIDPDFMDVVLQFNPSGSLKYLAEHALGIKPKYFYEDVEPDVKWRPIELGWAPTALAVSSPEANWAVYEEEDGRTKFRGLAWPGVIEKYITHWGSDFRARDYATDDIIYTRGLDGLFGYPTPGDDDSILSCMVPVIRWRGFRINIPGMKELLSDAEKIVAASPVNINKPSEVRNYIYQAMDDMEKVVLEESTKKANLEAVCKWKIEQNEECSRCFGDDKLCVRCNGTGVVANSGIITDKKGNHPAAIRAWDILEVKHAYKEIELYDKLITAGKFHASFNVVGTLSSRMSGGDGLNAQGIKKTKEVRCMFPLAWEGFNLCGGDFDSFEVTLADAVYGDENLRRDLLSGKKIHALFAMSIFPGKTYEEVIASDGSKTFDMYAKGKAGVFAMIYGGGWETLVQNLGISPDIAKKAFEDFGKRYPGVAKARERTFNNFCSMRQPNGIGSQVVWSEPADYVESFLGFRRYFTLENKICKALYDLSRKPPKGWKNHAVKVVRRDRVQTAGGAVSSALYGAAFQIQAANMRAAANHEIQSPGGQITKAVQRAIWDLQPVGVHPLHVAPMNVHDELMVSTHPEYVKRVTEAVRSTVEFYRKTVPLIGMSWFEEMANWAEKKDGAEKVKIRCHEMMSFK